jgi:hypothetical protein
MQDLKDVIEQMEPTPEEHGDWDAVLRDAVTRRRPALLRPLAGLAVAAAAVFGLALFQPWEGESPTFLERALAAVGDGPVLHVVLRGEWGGTLVDLESGAREPVYGENEVWYDFDRDLMHAVTKLGGVAESEELYEPREPAPDLRALGQEYRQALEQGTARIIDEGSLDGERVVWILIRSENLPDVADGKRHGWAEEIAVSRETFEPVALRQTRDGEPGRGTLQRVHQLEMLPVDQADFTVDEENSLDGRVFMEGREPIDLVQAKEALGRTPLWLGAEHHALRLAATFRTTRKTGRQPVIELTGEEEREAQRCFGLGPEKGRPCFRALGRHPLERRPDGVFTRGPTVWGLEKTGVELFYGTAGDEPSTFRTEDDVPLLDRPHVSVSQTTERSPFFRLGPGRYSPPDGSVLLHAGGRVGFLDVDGVYVAIEASSEQLILSAARALEPMPG